ncbi:MAG: LysR family transcriptional regulator [Planktomarina sp.]|nr:LysR family transcriptional regulator [Planktomarina sp.]MDT2058783.1 LysR family transcriptional regulator [Planktomarina sp.]MDT2073327.1 LysR family transcriptional regulator [Planktomarina sp.]
MNLNLRQLEALRATIRAGSITGAAKMMHISQPSVSRLVADLEYAVGFPLFVRVGRGLTPTVEGRHFYEGVEGMFIGIDRLDELAKSIRTSQGGVISIGAIQSISTIELPKAIGRLYNVNPEIRFEVQSRNTPAILDAVQTRQIDLGIVGREPDHQGVEILYQTSVPYVCLIPEDHWLAGEYGSVDLNQLADTETFVTFGDTYPDAMMSIEPGLSDKLRARSRLTVANMPLAGALVREASVLAISDPFSAEQAVQMGGVVFRPIEQNLTYFVTIVTAQRESLSREALKFVDFFSTQLKDRVDQVRVLSRESH